MATKKPSTKAKTKTTKPKTSTKAAAKTTAKKATTNTAAAAKTAAASTATKVTKEVEKATAIVSPKTEGSFISRVRELQIVSAGAFLWLALMAGYFIKDTKFNLTLTHLTKDDLLSKTSTTFAPAAHGLYDINLRWIVVGIMVISAILPLLWAFRWKRQYQLNIDAEAMPQRWFDLAITSMLMVEVVALLSGIHDIMTLKLIGGLMVATCALSWLADKQNRKATKPDWSAFVISLFTGSLPWIMIAVTAFSTFFYGMLRSPGYVYGLYGATLFGFGLIAFTQRQHYRRANQWKYEIVERNYTWINLLVKSAFALILIAGLHR